MTGLSVRSKVGRGGVGWGAGREPGREPPTQIGPSIEPESGALPTLGHYKPGQDAVLLAVHTRERQNGGE